MPPYIRCLLLATLCTAPIKDTRANDPAEVVFRFGWPDNLNVLVTYSRQRSGPASMGRPSQFSFSYTLRSKAASAGLNVLHSVASVAAQSQRNEVGAEASSLAPPDLLIDADGDLVDLIDVAGYLSAVRKTLGIPHSPQDKEAQALVLTPENTLAKARGDWGQLVSGWVGAKMKLGESQVEEAQSHMFGRSDLPIRFRTTATVKRWLPCNRAKLTLRCVEVELRNRPNVNDLMRAIAVASGGSQSNPGELDGIAVERIFTLVTDPSTLLPIRFTHVTQQIDSTGRRDTGQAPVVTETVTFQYRH